MLNFMKKREMVQKHEVYLPNGIEGFKDIHKGERCFIIGNGPSLRADDLDKLIGEYTFAVNRIYLIFEKTDWRPSYYAIQDQNLANRYYDEIVNLDLPVKFVSKKMENLIQGGKGRIYYYNYVRRLFDGSSPEFSDDPSKETFEGGTVTYLCLQLATYMGFSEIYLIGNDFDYSVSKDSNGVKVSNVKDYFSDAYISPKENRFLPRLDLCQIGFEYAFEYLSKRDVKVYNATRGGKLEVFPRVDFDELMGENDEYV